MADVDHVVDLRAASNASLADAGAVDTRVGLNFGVALDDNISRLDDFVPAALIVFRKAEAVGADHRTVLQEDVVAEAAEFADHGVGVSEEIVTDAGSAIDDDVGKKDGIVSDDGVGVDDHVRAEVRALADLGRGMNDRGGMDSDGVSGWLIEKFNGSGPGEVRILAAQHPGRDGGEIVCDNHGRSLGRLRGGVVFWIGDESQLAAAGSFDAGDSCDLGVWRCVVDAGSKGAGNVGKFHGSVFSSSNGDCSNSGPTSFS